MNWRKLTPEEIDVLDELDRVRRFIEKQCVIPDSPQNSREQQLESELIALRKLAEYMAEALNIAQMYLDAYRAEYPKIEQETA